METVKADVVNGDVVEVLRTLGNGRVLYDLAAGLEEVVNGLREYPQKTGSVTLKIVVSPMSRGDERRVTVDGTVTVKAPKKPAESKIFFTTKEGTLVRDDPQHMEFKGEGFERK